MPVSFFSPISINPAYPKENHPYLRFSTHMFNFGQKSYEICFVNKTLSELRETDNKPTLLGIIGRVVMIATLILPALMLLFIAIYRSSNKFIVEVEDDDREKCSICCEAFDRARTIVKLDCSLKHVFDKDCLEEWWRTSGTKRWPLDNITAKIVQIIPAKTGTE